MRKAIFAICALFVLLAQPLAAQSSSIGGLGSDIDIFMLPNWAYLVGYSNIYTFVQGMYTDEVPANVVEPVKPATQGIRAGFGKKIGPNSGQLHFYFAGTGFSLSDYTRSTETAAGSLKGVPPSTSYGYGTDTGGGLTMQFDSLYSNSKFGAIKLGLSASGIVVDTDLDERSATDYTETKTTRGTFTPSLEYGKNFYHDDGSMWTFSLGNRVAIPFYKTVTEEQTGGITTTTTNTINPANTDIPGISARYTTWTIAPTFLYMFKPKTAPVYTLYSLFLMDEVLLAFFPEYLTTTEVTNGATDGWTERSHSYFSNHFFGYVDAQHYITMSFLLRWRAQFGFLSSFEEYGNTKTKATDGTVTERKESTERYTLWPYVGGWIGFTYQAIPSLLSVTGGVALPIVGSNAASWYFQHTEITDDDYDLVTTADYTGFFGFYTQFSLGATLTLNSNFSFELGTLMDANTQKTGLNSVALTLKYKN
jgi:hypothetical protein